jgi:predicted transposase YbfD/YdcC
MANDLPAGPDAPSPAATTCPLMTHFADLPDPRSPLGRRHVLSDLLAIAICAAICGADGWAQVEEFGRAKHKWFATFLALPHGIPSHDTFGRVFAALDPDAFERCFVAWTTALAASSGGKLVAIDGKSLRRSFAHAWDASGMAHLVSAFVGANRLVLGQVAVAGADDDAQRRGNEITAIPKLLELLDLTGATVSIDAIGCQREVCREVLARGGQYVLCLKDNQPTLLAKVRLLLDEAICAGIRDLPGDHYQEVDGGHGRVETRRVWVSDQVQHLPAALRAQWPGLAAVAAVERVREVFGPKGKAAGEVKIETERHYYISSRADLGRNAAAMAGAVRGHWTIENQLHWHLDVSFGEDACRIRTDHGPENFSRLRRIALNLLQRETTNKRGIKTKRLCAGWDHDYLLKVLTG